MFIGISLIIIGIVGLIYGVVKKNKTAVIASIVLLIIVAIIWVVYSYMYSLNPY